MSNKSSSTSIIVGQTDAVQLELLRYNKNIVTKANNFLELSYRLSPLEQKIILFMVSLVQPDDQSFLLYRFSAFELVEFLDLKTHNYAEIGRLIRALKKKSLLIQSEKSILDVNWLSSAEYYKWGIIELEISQKLAPYFTQLRGKFTSYQLKNIISLKSSYSIRLYEILKKYERMREKSFTLEELKRIFQIENEYKLYGHFKKKVIQVAERELKEKCDICFSFTEITNGGKKVVGVRFAIRSNSKKDHLGVGWELDELHRIAFDKIVWDLNILDKKLKAIFNKYEFEKIEQAHLETVNRMKVQHIDNPSGYFVSLLSNAEFGLSERHEKQKRKQLQMKIVEDDKTEHKELERETEVKRQVTAWILEHPDKFEEMVEEEGHRLGWDPVTKNQAKVFARLRVAKEFL